jgi:hypothetical protein
MNLQKTQRKDDRRELDWGKKRILKHNMDDCLVFLNCLAINTNLKFTKDERIF